MPNEMFGEHAAYEVMIVIKYHNVAGRWNLARNDVIGCEDEGGCYLTGYRCAVVWFIKVRADMLRYRHIACSASWRVYGISAASLGDVSPAASGALAPLSSASSAGVNPETNALCAKLTAV